MMTAFGRARLAALWAAVVLSAWAGAPSTALAHEQAQALTQMLTSPAVIPSVATPPDNLPSSHSPRASARRATRPLVIDGDLGEPNWNLAPANDHFTQQFPDEMAPPSDRTTFRVLYDDDALYVGVDCRQVSIPVSALVTRRDRVGQSDRVTVDIDTRADGTQAAHFGVSAAGVLDDGIYFNDNSYANTWDENWEGAAAITATGWSAEFRIPFRILRIDLSRGQAQAHAQAPAPVSAPAHVWGFQVQRFVGLRNEWDLWSYRPRSSAGVVSTYGTLDGIENIGTPRPIELRPAILGRVRHRDREARSAFARETDWTWSLGLDARTHPTPGTTLDLAFNPDFGQVEADQVVLNLSNTEVAYPEKRPFFLEGLDIFSTPRSILYTRRIGARAPDPRLDSSQAETVVEPPEPTRLWAAAKWVGGVGKATNIGMLSALAGQSDVGIRIGGGAGGSPTEQRRVASPTTVFNVLRLQRRVAQQFDLGVMATAANRVEHPDSYPLTGFLCGSRVDSPDPNIAAAPGIARRCTNDAYVGAVDARWKSPSAVYAASAQVVGSLLQAGPPRPAKDGIATRPGHPGFGMSLKLAKQGGRHFLATLEPSFSTTQLDYNDVGYLDRKNDKAIYADVTFRRVERWGPTLESGARLGFTHKQTFDDQGRGFLRALPLESNLRLATFATFANFWAVELTGYVRAARFDDRETGDGTALERAGLVGGEVWFGSDRRRPLVVTAWGQGQRVRDVAGKAQGQMSASITWRLTTRLDLEVSPSFGHVAGEPRFLAKEADATTAAVAYSFGRLEANNVALTVRSTLGLSTRLTLQFYGQLFLATKHFSDPSRADLGGGAAGERVRIHIADLQPVASLPAVAANPDVQQTVVNINVVLRWEYRLGSVLYVVYARTQDPVWIGSSATPSPAVRPTLSGASLGSNRAAIDTLLLKLAYWWG